MTETICEKGKWGADWRSFAQHIKCIVVCGLLVFLDCNESLAKVNSNKRRPNKYDSALQQIFQRAFYKIAIGKALYLPYKTEICDPKGISGFLDKFTKSDNNEQKPLSGEILAIFNQKSLCKPFFTMILNTYIDENSFFATQNEKLHSRLCKDKRKTCIVASINWEIYPSKGYVRDYVKDYIIEAINLINNQKEKKYNDLIVINSTKKIMKSKLNYTHRADAENKFEEWKKMDVSNIPFVYFETNAQNYRQVYPLGATTINSIVIKYEYNPNNSKLDKYN